MSWETKLKQEKEREVMAPKPEEDKSVPHLTNLNEDPQLTGKLYYGLVDCPVYVGRKTGEPKPTIILGGVGIQRNHAVFEKDTESDDILLRPQCEKASECIFVNGKKVEGEHRLEHNDRIIFGTTTVFIFKYPAKSHLKRRRTTHRLSIGT